MTNEQQEIGHVSFIIFIFYSLVDEWSLFIDFVL